MFNFFVDLAFIAMGALQTLGCIAGLVFFVLVVKYIYDDRHDGNLFGWLDDVYDADWRDDK